MYNSYIRNIIGKKLIKLVDYNPDKPWNWDGLSRNPNITWEIIKNNPEKDRSNYINSTPKTQLVSRNKFWDWYGLSKNPNITWEIVVNNPDKPWNWRGLSRNCNITWEIIQNNSEKPWDWYSLSQHNNITLEIVENNPDKFRNWGKFFERNQVWYILSWNKFNGEYKELYDKYLIKITKILDENLKNNEKNLINEIAKCL